MSLLGGIQSKLRVASAARRAAALIVCAALAVLAACASGGSASVGSASPTSSASAGGAKADTSLCDIIAPKDFYAAVGGPVGKQNSTISTVAGSQVVNCAYLPAGLPGAGGLISFVFTGDGATYYTHMKLDEQGQLNSENDLSGLGDAAYWGTQSGSPDIFELKMRKGNVVVAIEMDGSAQDGSTYLDSAKQFAQTILSHL
jgi:hypothetical protein